MTTEEPNTNFISMNHEVVHPHRDTEKQKVTLPRSSAVWYDPKTDEIEKTFECFCDLALPFWSKEKNRGCVNTISLCDEDIRNNPVEDAQPARFAPSAEAYLAYKPTGKALYEEFDEVLHASDKKTLPSTSPHEAFLLPASDAEPEQQILPVSDAYVKQGNKKTKSGLYVDPPHFPTVFANGKANTREVLGAPMI